LAGAALSLPSLVFAGPRVTKSQAAVGRKSVAEVDPRVVRQFASGLRGRVILPADPDYEAARHVWNWAVDKHPGMIVCCAGAEDVVRAVDFARSHDLLTAVRAGGHSLAGKSVCDGGLVIDVAGMKRIQIDPVTRTARAEAGLTLGEFDHATQAVGLATTLGTAPPTGIAGLTLGGGLGWLMGKHGLACDNVLEVELVTAEGRTLVANAQTNAALYWAVRGAGANFGVVTVLEYRLHPVGPVLAGPVIYPPARLGEMLRFYREFATNLPDEASVQTGTQPLPGKPEGPWIAVCYCGDLDTGEKVLKPLRSFGPRVVDAVRPIPYVEMQALLDVPPVHLSAYVRSSFLRELSDEAIDVITAHAAQAPSAGCFFFVEEFHGAVCRVGQTDTAFGRREPGYNFAVFVNWQDPSEAQRMTEWGRRFWDAMQPFVHTAVYANYLADEGEARARAAYGANYERLVALKTKYDPTNFFRLNQNIKPTTQAASGAT
jgi:hypothetical protein